MRGRYTSAQTEVGEVCEAGETDMGYLLLFICGVIS